MREEKGKTKDNADKIKTFVSLDSYYVFLFMVIAFDTIVKYNRSYTTNSIFVKNFNRCKIQHTVIHISEAFLTYIFFHTTSIEIF